ncbi:MAG: hypothetical protein ABR981_02700 [Candidatus Micrarchaeaceae archaeon]|jgi:hypothetical protein
MKNTKTAKKSKEKSPKGRNDIIEELNKNPDEKNWSLFGQRAKKDKAKYYYVIYPKEVKDSLNLKKAYAVIYDGKYKQLYKVPIIKTKGNGIIGATMYLKGLEVNRKVIQ